MTLAHGVSLLFALGLHWLQRVKSTPWIWYSSYLMAYLGFFLLGISRNAYEFGLAVVLIELSCAAGIFALRLIRAQAIPFDSFGKVSSLLFLLQQLSLPLGGMLVAPFLKTDLLQSSFLFWSTLTGIITLLLLGSMLRLK